MLNIPNLQDKNILFPDPNTALKEPNGLLACMGNLRAETLLKAYQKGIFPWYNEQDQPILWWSPNPRSVIYPNEINISHSLKKSIRTQPWEIRIDTEFETVIKYCANVRKNKGQSTWINTNMQHSYIDLHNSGYAHSLEVWFDDDLVGGLYGIVLGDVFCGESMFSLKSNASKVALVQLALLMRKYTKNGLIDCQIENDHLSSMGSRNIPREAFLIKLKNSGNKPNFWPYYWKYELV
ncbi:MAG: leucyl/phenylalanyl-tRNA--protein transferase [Gammaproteobacteria bacterium]|nr:leucyl/phenylalanyl-tRNA--protein transferase [Gammaproteobacteria bacterium]